MIEHVGFVTDDRERFEQFWCGVLGYRVAREGDLSHELTMALFGIPGGAKTVRYTPSERDREDALVLGLDGPGPDIETHVFAHGCFARPLVFRAEGLNHVSLKVRDKRTFADRLPEDVFRVWYKNPGGWYNLFVRDYDGNWVEVRD